MAETIDGWRWQPLRRGRDGSLSLRWLSRRAVTGQWYPQGIDVGSWRGRDLVAVSWFRRDRTGAHLASRITLVDPARSRRLDVALAVPGESGPEPARIHAGGLAWFGDRVFVAATDRGLWEFDLAALTATTGDTARRLRGKGTGAHGPTLAAVRTRVHPMPLRCSFVGRVVDSGGDPRSRVAVGEYSPADGGRIAEFEVPAPGGTDSFTKTAEYVPGIPRMQGVVRLGDRTLVSQSDGLRWGRLWHGDAPALALHPRSLPVGTEDLAVDTTRGLLWCLGEHPWRRVVRGIPLSDLGL